MTRHYPQKLALTSPTSGGRSVGIVRSRTKATELLLLLLLLLLLESQVPHCCDPVSITGQIMWNLWWTKWYWAYLIPVLRFPHQSATPPPHWSRCIRFSITWRCTHSVLTPSLRNQLEKETRTQGRVCFQLHGIGEAYTIVDILPRATGALVTVAE
jgi:hypothetical protein